jgi:transposase
LSRPPFVCILAVNYTSGLGVLGVIAMPTGGERRRVANDLRRLILTDVDCGFAPIEISQRLRVSTPFITQLRKTYDAFGTVSPTHLLKPGPDPKIHTEAAEGMLNLLDEDPQAEQKDHIELLELEYGIQVHKSTVSRKLKEMKLTYKCVERTNQAQDPELRADYQGRICEYEPEQCVFVDESAANEHTAHSRRGWSPRGTACRVKYAGRRSRRWSILPALGLNGYIDYDLYHGSYNKERFLNFIERLLATKMNAYGPGVPRSVLIMDNAPIHSGPELQRLCDSFNVVLEFLPPYSPDLNPIEETFHELKAWMKRHRKLAAEYAEDNMFELFLVIGIEAVVRRESARGYFRHCGWDVSDDNDDIAYSALPGEDEVDVADEVLVEY